MVCIAIIVLHSDELQMHGGSLSAPSMHCSLHLCFEFLVVSHRVVPNAGMSGTLSMSSSLASDAHV